jgi:AmmeMemoRadiSam system protein B
MSNEERPRLRPGLAAAPDPAQERYVYLWDRLHLSDRHERLTKQELDCAQLFDGERTLRDIQALAVRAKHGDLLPLESIESLVRRLDDALFLDSRQFRTRFAGPVREPSCLGCYEEDAGALRLQLRHLFIGPGGSGLPGGSRPDGRLCAALLPHIDYARGGITYTWGFKELVERTAASLFVIVGTSHQPVSQRFTLTRKNFKTPLGIVPTDQAYIDRLEKYYGDGLFDDELIAHLPEWSIELEVVFLQYLFESRRPIRIVPLVVGSFFDCIRTGDLPMAQDDIAQMVEALRRAEAETPEPVCYVISGDLAHIGPKFGDSRTLTDKWLSQSRERDQALLQQTEAADADGWFREIADEGDRRRICGLPPTYTVLEALGPAGGKVLHYDQYRHPRGSESVSFASVAFYR